MFESNQRVRTWGFRFFTADAFTILLVIVAVAFLRRIEGPFWWLLLIVIGHFFLFCNLIRLRRRLELAWAIAFVLNCAAWAWFGNLDCRGVLALQLPVTVCVVAFEMRSGRYHGIFARRINRKLNDYLAGR